MSSVPSTPALTVRYQDHIGSLSRTDSRAARVLSQSTRVHVLRDKIDDEAATRLELTAQSLGAQITASPAAANVVVTILRAPKRIRKHFDDDDLNVFPAPDPVPADASRWWMPHWGREETGVASSSRRNGYRRSRMKERW